AFWKAPAGQRLIERIPQRRVGQAEHLDGALLLLASDAGQFMTGSVVTVDGGHTVSSLLGNSLSSPAVDAVVDLDHGLAAVERAVDDVVAVVGGRRDAGMVGQHA